VCNEKLIKKKKKEKKKKEEYIVSTKIATLTGVAILSITQL
jgi:hypothetical protein